MFDLPALVVETHQVVGWMGPFYAPNVNSYKRFTPGSFAPTTFTWGRDNRTCAVRVVGRGEGLHLEIRVPGADANPYLALSAVLAAIDHGLERKLTPGPETTGNAYRAGGIPVPPTLGPALTAFQNSALAQEAFGTGVVEHLPASPTWNSPTTSASSPTPSGSGGWLAPSTPAAFSYLAWSEASLGV